MARNKKTNGDPGRRFFDFGSSSKPSKSGSQINFMAVLKVLLVPVALVAIGFVFYYLEQYVQTSPKVRHQVEKLKLDKPPWVSQELMKKIKQTVSEDENFKIDDDLAETAAKKLSALSWFKSVQVQVAGESLVISAKWRKPSVVFERQGGKVYVASDLTVLDFMPVVGLPIVELRGVSEQPPAVGQIWQRDDVAAAIELMRLLDVMDEKSAAEMETFKPLLNQIAAIDVTNFDGRKVKDQPHIILIAKDGTQINWGARIGVSQNYVEADDLEKLSTLYNYYKNNGTLQGIARYIELRYPQKNIQMPPIEQ